MKEEKFTTEQEKFWAGNFGDDYTERNVGENWIASNTAFFSKVLKNTYNINSVIEFGSNIGLNLVALKTLLPKASFSAIEINNSAINELKKNIDNIEVFPMSIFDYSPKIKKDLVFIKGVLIHLNPEKLSEVYECLYNASSKYILIAEYYNPTPVSIPYRGHTDKLFKRDFAGEILEKYKDLTLIDYGFVYHKDNNFPQDDITWFLIEKSNI
jgi:spore coat polysaccharide biosynthesis protein SpsF